MPAPDEGVSGGGPDGGAVAGGSAGGVTGGGGMIAFDAGHLDCTFETPFDLGDGPNPSVAPSAWSQVAVLDNGETIYAWNDPVGVRWVVQSATGVLGTPQTDVGSIAPGVSLVASGNRALLVYSKTTPELRARRYSNGAWSSGEAVPPTPQGFGSVLTTLEPSGATSVWRQNTYAMTPYFEATSDGTSAFAQATVVDAGFLYAAHRATGTRLVVALSSFAGVPEVVISSSGSETHTPMTGAMVTGNDLFQAALADDGTAVVAGVFSIGSVGVGALVRTGGTFSAPQLIAPHGTGTARTLGALAGPSGRGTVIWWDTQVLYLSRRTGSTWSPPQNLGATGLVVPRFTRTTASRGLLHYTDGAGQPLRVELTVEGVVGAPISNAVPAFVSGTEYAGAGTRAATIATSSGPDGGSLIRGSQCR